MRVWRSTAAELARAAGGRGNPLRGRVVHGLALAPGRIQGVVRAPRERDARVEVSWAIPADAAWERASERLAARARCLAALLDGTVDGALADELAEAGIVLAPEVGALRPHCERDGDGWCVHARALQHAAALRVSNDPTVLLELAGRPREALLGRVRDLLGLAPTRTDVASASEQRHEAPVRLTDIVVAPAPPHDVTAVIDGLGLPPGVDEAAGLEAAVASAAAFAWAIAAGEGEEEADRQLLLATLRAGGTMTAAGLAVALGIGADDAELELERLHAAGEVLRTGPEGLRRYRAR